MKPSTPYDVCIVSSTSVSTGPRVEKEADALAAAGYRVGVIVCHSNERMVEWDARMSAERGWQLLPIDWLPQRRKRTLSGMAALALHHAARRACLGGVPAAAPLAMLACSDRFLPLTLRALRVPARLYIAHNLGALPAAAFVARARGVPFAFDSEDDHFGELTPQLQQAGQGRIVHRVMQACLERAAYVSAASEGIGRAVSMRHGIAQPTTVLNAFSVSMRERIDGLRKDRNGDDISLYWYSNTIGLDRGLQDVISALGRVRGAFQLHVRGDMADDVERALRALATQHGVSSRLHFHPQTHPDDLLSRAAEHDIGLAVEQPVNDNKLLAVSNKLLLYLLARVAIVATSTPGQNEVVRESGDAIATYAPGEVATLAMHLQRLIDDRALLETRKQQALELGMTRFNAEHELQKLTPLVARALEQSRIGSR